MRTEDMVETVASGRDALKRHAWDEAFDAFVAADREHGLGPDDLQLMADAAWWSGHPDDADEALQRAFAGFSRAGDHTAAAIVAMRLGERAFRRGAMPVAQGWMSQGERLLEGAPESAAHAWLEFMNTAVALLYRNDPDSAISHADRALELGRRHNDQDVQALTMSFKGAALLRKGELDAGLALIDEATAIATTGMLGPKAASDVYCVTIGSCRSLADYGRAGEWADEAERWMRRESIRGYTGVCRVHKAELARLRGSWAEAEREARLACDELERYRLMAEVGYAHSEVGEVRRYMGDLAGAEEAFTRAYEYGWDPQPGLALLHLARGEVEEATSSISRSLAALEEVRDGGRAVEDPFGRAFLLPAVVEIALAGDDMATARAAADKLEEIARDHPGVAREASALAARGAVLLKDNEPEEAISALDRAWRLWQEISLPYESARARLLLGRARLAAGEESAGHRELKAAQSAFQQLGAAPGLAVVNDLLGEEASDEGRRRVVRTFVFTDIVTSTDLIELIGDAAWEELLRWHDRTLRSAFNHHRGEVVRHTGDGFFATFEEPNAALQCAVDIQRQLADHRHQHGFAPWVRIGMHAAEATMQGDDYAGQGVHVAARVAALADREEILATSSTLAAASTIGVAVSEPRSVALKGIKEPIDIQHVEWR
jgi:class 3 adenylate cyclase